MRRRTAILTTALALSFLLAACNGGGEPGAKTTAPASDEPSPTETLAAADKGEYLYAAYGVRAELVPDDDGSWTMTVTNKTGHSLGKTGIYALDARDGTRINAKLQGAAPLANNKSQEVTVTWEKDFVPQDIGLVILTFGSDNFGNFAYGR